MADPKRPVLIVVDEDTLRRIVSEAVSRALEGRAKPQRLYTPEEAGEFLGVHAKTILKWAKSGELPCRKLGERVYRFAEADLLKRAG